MAKLNNLLIIGAVAAGLWYFSQKKTDSQGAQTGGNTGSAIIPPGGSIVPPGNVADNFPKANDYANPNHLTNPFGDSGVNGASRIGGLTGQQPVYFNQPVLNLATGQRQNGAVVVESDGSTTGYFAGGHTVGGAGGAAYTVTRAAGNPDTPSKVIS